MGADSLHLYADPALHLPSTDPEGRDLILSCGIALHHSRVALAALGWPSKVHRLPDRNDPKHLATVKVYGHAATKADIKLAAAILHRHTDRRRYSSRKVPSSYIALLGADAASTGIMVRQIKLSRELQQTVAQAVQRHTMDRDYLTELATWSGRYASLTGVPARNAPMPDPTAPLPPRLFAGPALAQPSGTASVRDNAAVLALGTKDDSVLAQLRAGESTSLILLRATALGLASCPLTEPLELTQTRDAVQIQVFGISAFPQMLLRIGFAPVDADPLPATPRRPLHDIVEYLDGPVFD